MGAVELINPMEKLFRKFATQVSFWAGSPHVFVTAIAIVILWAACGPMFGFSDTWQLVINTSTTIITFLMVFLIQNTQNRDGKAMQLKLDELIRVNRHARDRFLDLEELEEKELDKLHDEFQRLQDEAEGKLKAVTAERLAREAKASDRSERNFVDPSET